MIIRGNHLFDVITAYRNGYGENRTGNTTLEHENENIEVYKSFHFNPLKAKFLWYNLISHEVTVR